MRIESESFIVFVIQGNQMHFWPKQGREERKKLAINSLGNGEVEEANSGTFLGQMFEGIG